MIILNPYKKYILKYFTEELKGTEHREEREITYIDKNFKTHKLKVYSGECPKGVTDDDIFLYYKASTEVAKMYTKGLITLEELNKFFEDTFEEAKKSLQAVEEMKLFN